MNHPCYSGKKRATSFVNLAEQASSADLDQLAVEWVEGGRMKNLKLLYGEQSVRRLTGLPGYPFEKKHCWFQDQTRSHSKEPSLAVSRDALSQDSTAEKKEEEHLAITASDQTHHGLNDGDKRVLDTISRNIRP